jgi:hypothetical protein
MAQQNVVPSLFGITPELYQQNRMADLQAQQIKAATMAAGPGTMMNPSLAPLYAQAAQQGQIVGEGARAVGSLLGIEDPELAKIRDVQQMRTQFDVSTPDGLRSFAQALGQKGYTDLAMQAAGEADRRELTQAQTVRAGREPAIQSFDRLVSSGKYTPESLAKYQNSGNVGDLVLVKGAGGEGGVEGPGPVGKAGAFRDVDGNILGATEMKNIRTEFTEGQKLLKLLNDATAQDIKDAESFVDWTTAGVTKGLASSKTLNAQTKLAAAQLIEQIGNLPPGSASDADMRASMKSFPGYSDPESLRQWVNRTKSKLQSRMEDISGQFGFQQRVVSSGEIKFEKPSTKKAPAASAAPPAPQDADSLVNKYLTPKK